MKSTITLIILIFSFTACKKEMAEPTAKQDTQQTDLLKPASCNTYFYYYMDQPITLGQALTDKIIVGFPKGTDSQTKQQVLDKHKAAISIASDNQTTTSDFIIVNLRNGLKCSDVEALLTQLLRENAVTYANPFLQIGDPAQEVGITDEFIVSLKDNTSFSDLESLAQQTQTQVVDSLGFGTYILSATKKSQGNTVNMANHFYEQELFKTSEPNFFMAL